MSFARLLSVGVVLTGFTLVHAQFAAFVAVNGDPQLAISIPRLMVLELTSVQKELGLTEGAKEKVLALVSKWESDAMSFDGDMKLSDLGKIDEILLTRAEPAAKKVEVELRTILGNKAFARYQEIARQASAPHSILEADLNLTQDQLESLRDIESQFRQAVLEVAGELPRRPNNGGISVGLAGHPKIAALQDQFGKKMLLKLTAEQRDKWKVLLGTPAVLKF